MCRDDDLSRLADIEVKTIAENKIIVGIDGAYKTTASKKIHLIGHNYFVWQRSFYDHIIRSTVYYDKIFEHIISNP